MKKNVIWIIGLCLLLTGCSMGKEQVEPETKVERVQDTTEAEPEEKEELPIFYTQSMEALENEGELNIEEYYITNRITGLNHYYIDENAVLWGTGRNECGQLGNGMVDELGSFNITTEPVRIAENVVSVDCSVNGYFCIHLTKDGKLYGMGANILGLLGEGDLKLVYSIEEYDKVTTPVLLMEDVAYARAGREAIVALKNDGSVWWWGQYVSVYQTKTRNPESYWAPHEDEQNEAKMLYNAPKKILEDCIYVATGDWTGAAINENGDLYTWGLNVFGECGTPVTEDDYVRKPQKVLENVRMVWPDEIKINSVETEIPEMMDYSTTYPMNMFVQLENGDILAAGQGIGDKQRTIGLTGDLAEESTHTYSDAFIPVKILDVAERE